MWRYFFQRRSLATTDTVFVSSYNLSYGGFKIFALNYYNCVSLYCQLPAFLLLLPTYLFTNQVNKHFKHFGFFNLDQTKQKQVFEVVMDFVD